MTLAGAVAAKTHRVRIGTFLLLLPLHNAVRVAEDGATVDVISRGRFDLGIGKGYAKHEFLGYGIPRKERASRFEEGIDVIRGIWTQDPFSFQGKHYNLQDIRLTPKPVQQPHPPLWVGALNPKAVDRAARLGCHFLGIGDTSAYDEALRRHGRNPSRLQRRATRVGAYRALQRAGMGRGPGPRALDAHGIWRMAKRGRRGKRSSDAIQTATGVGVAAHKGSVAVHSAGWHC